MCKIFFVEDQINCGKVSIKYCPMETMYSYKTPARCCLLMNESMTYDCPEHYCELDSCDNGSAF